MKEKCKLLSAITLLKKCLKLELLDTPRGAKASMRSHPLHDTSWGSRLVNPHRELFWSVCTELEDEILLSFPVKLNAKSDWQGWRTRGRDAVSH